MTWDRTQAAAVESQRLTAWAMARPGLHIRRSFALEVTSKDVK
jgi:hypothetical protein